jgi:hypothetical protein
VVCVDNFVIKDLNFVGKCICKMGCICNFIFLCICSLILPLIALIVHSLFCHQLKCQKYVFKAQMSSGIGKNKFQLEFFGFRPTLLIGLILLPIYHHVK